MFKVFTFGFRCWKFLFLLLDIENSYFLFLDVEGFCSYFYMLKVFAFGFWRFLLLLSDVEGLWFLVFCLFTYSKEKLGENIFYFI